jgi:hypothetical protein
MNPDANEVPLCLQRNSPVPLADQIPVPQLAKELNVQPERLQALIDRNYLRVLMRGQTLEETFVARPLPAAMVWLEIMLQPLRLRPLLPASEIAEMLEMPQRDVAGLCLHYGIPLYDDPAFGELISIAGFRALNQAMHESRDPLRTDRIALAMRHVAFRGEPVKTLQFSDKIEAEAKRICQMEEPQRTMVAARFLSAYRDANTLAECWAKYNGKPLPVVTKEGRALRKILAPLNDLVTPAKLPVREVKKLEARKRSAKKRREKRALAKLATSSAVAADAGPSASGS